MVRIILLFIFCTLLACNEKKVELTAQQIVDKSIIASGVDKLSNAKLSFDFRDIHYQAKRNNGKFLFTRSFDSITDKLSNKGFERFINNKKIVLSDSLANVYSNSVNSVHYFSVLPLNLNDKAVFKKRLSDSKIDNQNYYRLQITFSEDRGGDDYEDIFIYWINKNNFLIDYLAYSYKTDGGGMRFRALKNEKEVQGIRFRNFDNYKPKSTISLEKIDSAFINGNLEKVSEIIIRNINVELN